MNPTSSKAAPWLYGRGRIALSVATLLTLAACGGNCATVPYPTTPPPGGEVQASLIHTQLNRGTLQFFEDNIGTLLGGFLVSDTSGLAKFNLGGQTAPGSAVVLSENSYIAFRMQNLQEQTSLSWLTPDTQGRPGIHFSITNAELYLNVLFQTNIDLFADSACRVSDDGVTAALTLGGLSFDMRLDIDQSAGPATLSLNVENLVVDLAGITDELALALNVETCDGNGIGIGNDGVPCLEPVCTAPGAQCPQVCELIDLFTQLGGFMGQIVQPLLDNFAPLMADTISTVFAESLAGVPLELETAIDPSTLAQGLLPQSTPLHIKMQAASGLGMVGTGYAQSLTVALDAGVAAPTLAPCAAGFTAPDLAALAGPPPDYTGFVEIPQIDTLEPHLERYHAAIGISQAMIEQLGWNLFSSGTLCMKLGGTEMEALTGGAFTLNAALLQAFEPALVSLGSPKAPLMLTLTPSEPPIFQLGAGEIDCGGSS